jgi:S1-C subfamily serine protease
VRPRFGVIVNDAVGQRITAEMGVEGVLVLGVQPGSPAAEAGLRGTIRDEDGSIVPGDVIVAIDGRPVGSADDVFRALDRHQPGDVMQVTIVRQGRRATVAVTLGAARGR